MTLNGILTALATPFSADGGIDHRALRALVDRGIDGGVDGLVACGSTGEFTALTVDERRDVVETVVDQAAGRVPVIAQTGALSTAEAVELSRHAQACGVSVIMPVTPYYEPLTLEETVAYLRSVAASVDIEVMLYNHPSATGVDLTPEVVGRLAREIENVRYIKYTSSDFARTGQLVHHLGDEISAFVGWDSLVLAAFVEGAAGAVAGTANVFPAALVSIADAVRSGDMTRARSEWEQLYPLMDAIMSAPFVPAIKAALRELGLTVGSPRPPCGDLDPETLATISRLTHDVLEKAAA